jgi:hypothetical protein
MWCTQGEGEHTGIAFDFVLLSKRPALTVHVDICDEYLVFGMQECVGCILAREPEGGSVGISWLG